MQIFLPFFLPPPPSFSPSLPSFLPSYIVPSIGIAGRRGWESWMQRVGGLGGQWSKTCRRACSSEGGVWEGGGWGGGGWGVDDIRNRKWLWQKPFMNCCTHHQSQQSFVNQITHKHTSSWVFINPCSPWAYKLLNELIVFRCTLMISSHD